MKLADLYNVSCDCDFETTLSESKDKDMFKKPYPGQSSGALKRWVFNHYNSKVNCRTASRVKNDPLANNFYKKRASWYQNIHCKGGKQVMKEDESWLELPDQVTHFLENLSDYEAGSHRIGSHVVCYNGFNDYVDETQTDDMNHENGDFDSVYEELIDNWCSEHNQSSPLTSGLAGSDQQPILYAVFSLDNNTNSVDNHIEEAINSASFTHKTY